MLLSSSVIKNIKVINQGKKEIVTDSVQIKKQSIEEIREILKNTDDDSVNAIEKFDEIAQSIIDNAKSQADSIRVKAISDAEVMKGEAYNKAYEEGTQSGYKDAYNETIVKSKTEAENIMKTAEEKAVQLVNSAKLEYEKYLLNKRIDIKKLALFIAEQILKREVKNEDGINEMIYDAVNASKNSNLIVIKCNKLHYEAVKESIELWKKQVPLKGEIFVIEDNFVNEGNAIIEKDNGKIELGLDVGLSKIKEEIMK